jgi:hypothetical protein
VKLGVVESARGPFLLLCILSLFGAAAWTLFMSLFNILFNATSAEANCKQCFELSKTSSPQ